MKKILVLLLILIFTLTMESCSTKETILIYATSEEERISFLQGELNKRFPEYEIIIQYAGTGELVSKLQGEGLGTDCDIIYELEVNNLELLLDTHPTILYELSEYDFSKFRDEVLGYNHKFYAPTCMMCGTILINTQVLKENNLDIPETYDDLLDSKYINLISMPNPKNSATGYSFYSGLVSVMGEKDALKYFKKLDKNIKEYTSSGSAPLKACDRGEIGIAFTLLWQGVLYSQGNPNLKCLFLDQGSPYNLYGMGIINGHQERPAVKEVFEYIYNELNLIQTQKFTPDPVYKNQVPENPNYPSDFSMIDMVGLFEPNYKQELLDKWEY